MDATIVIATFGSDEWRQRGTDLALKITEQFPGMEIVFGHGNKLHETRNRLAARATSEWLCFLDADDELSQGYFDAMQVATGDLRAPAVRWVQPDGQFEQKVLDDRDIEVGNPCVIGTLIRKDMFDSVGGFKKWWAWEDWALFLSAHRKGAVLEHVPDAVYIAHVHPESRNNTVKQKQRLWNLIRMQS